jgi:signal transduction histidine kinase
VSHGPLRAQFRSSTLRYGEGAVGWAAIRREPLSLDLAQPISPAGRPAATEWVGSEPLPGYLALPILFETNGNEAAALLGAITLHRATPFTLSTEDRTLLDAFSAQVAAVLRNAALYADLVREREAAQAATRVKADFLATMSHETQTPISVVIGKTDLLLDTRLDPEQRRYASAVRSAAESLLTLINDILDVSKIDAGALQLEQADFQVRALVEEVVTSFAEASRRRGLELLCLVEPAVPAELRGDPTRLRQVLSNLVGNAVKFTHRGEILIEVAVTSESVEGVTLRVSVTDTGIGIAPEARTRLFQAFTQGDSTTTRKYGGTGLGLAISRQLVERMGGQIDVESHPGHGSTFWFRVPLGRSTTPSDRHPQAPEPWPGRRVLTVDDRRAHHRVLHSYLAAWGGPERGRPVARRGARARAIGRGQRAPLRCRADRP